LDVLFRCASTDSEHYRLIAFLASKNGLWKSLPNRYNRWIIFFLVFSYALMQVGWDQERRVRGNLIYVNIENNKVVIEYDGLENGITQDLIERGISKDDIILAFLPDSKKS
jgi:hypothetical protein